MNLKSLIILPILFLLPFQAKAQEVLTLNQAIKIAADSNLMVQNAVRQIQLQQALKGTSWDLEKTSLDYEYGQMNSIQKDNSFAVSQTMAFPSVYINQHKLAKANVKNSETELRLRKNEIITEVKKTWWLLAYYQSRLNLLQYQDSLYSGFYRAATKRAQAGETNYLEQLSAETQSLEAKNMVAQVKADIEICRNKLRLLLNIRKEIRIADTVLIKLPLLEEASGNESPILEGSRQKTEIARLETKMERAKLMPDLKFGYFNQSIIGTQEVNGINKTFTTTDRFSGIEAGIAVPLWFVPQVSRVKASKIKHDIARTEAAYTETSLKGELDNLLLEYEKYSGSIQYYESRAIPQANMIITQAGKSFHAGDMDYMDYIQNLSRAIAIKSNYLDALSQYNQTIIAIEYLTGKN